MWYRSNPATIALEPISVTKPMNRPDCSLSVLIVEDNASLAANVYDYLEGCGHRPDAAPDGRAALALLEQNRYDVIVLDWLMPRMDGLTVLQQIRERLGLSLPVIMLTARAHIGDKLEIFAAGADDYLVKPIAMAELEMRLRVHAGRNRAAPDPLRILCIADLRFDLDTLVVSRGDRQIELSPIRRALLESLMRAAPKVVTRAELAQAVWGDAPPDGDILRSHVHLLRKALTARGEVELIDTVAGAGYRMRGEA